VSHQDSFPKQTEVVMCVGLDDEDGSCDGTIQEGAYDKEIKDHSLLQQVLCSPFQHTLCVIDHYNSLPATLTFF